MSTPSTHRRPLAPARPIAVTFDERLWPVVIALVALAGLGAAAILEFADFHSVPLWNNGWTWLGSLGVVTLLAIGVTSRLDRSRRGVQLAAVLSLIFHILLFAALNHQRMIALAEARSPELERPEPADTFKAPDYHIRAPEDPIEEHEKPVATALPEEQPIELERLEKQRIENEPPEAEPGPPLDDAPDAEPHAVPRHRPQEAAPRLAENSAEFTRAEPPAIELSEPQPVALPPQQLAAELETPRPDAAIARRALPPDAADAASPPEADAALEPLEIEVAALAPKRTAQAPAAADRPAPSDGTSGRSPKAPQLEAPRLGELPRAQAGVEKRLEEPQPLVKAPLRSGSGSRLPLETGTVRNLAAGRVALGPTAATSADSSASPAAGEIPRRVGAGEAAEVPAPRAAGTLEALQKSTAPANVTPSPTAIGQSATIAPSAATPRAPAAIGPVPVKPLGKAQSRLALRIPAPAGAGGVAADMTPDVGTPSRRARQDSQVVQADARLLARTSGGPPTIDGRTREPAAAFARRGPMRRNRDGAADKTTEQTEAAIELGLVFLARHQAPEGSWSLHYAPRGEENPDPAPMYRAETAATGLALLAFLGAGYDHYGGQYAQVVQRALDYLIQHQQPGGDLYRAEDAESDTSARLYSHGIAAIALCEAYGMTGDRALAAPAQKAIDFILASQDPALGGWRYIPGSGADTSVSGWQLMALKSGELAGLDVPRAAYDKVQRWLDVAQATSSQYVYNPRAPDTLQQRHGRRPTPAMTAVGLLMRLYTGLNRDDAHMIEGAEYLLSRLPENGTATQPARDTYYWYYATQVMFHMRGKYWQAWNERLHPLLVGEQVHSGALAGSWHPRQPVPDRWGPHGGRIYVTTLNLLSLEVHYRHLPLYESTAQ